MSGRNEPGEWTQRYMWQSLNRTFRTSIMVLDAKNIPQFEATPLRHFNSFLKMIVVIYLLAQLAGHVSNWWSGSLITSCLRAVAAASVCHRRDSLLDVSNLLDSQGWMCNKGSVLYISQVRIILHLGLSIHLHPYTYIEPNNPHRKTATKLAYHSTWHTILLMSHSKSLKFILQFQG